MADFYNPIKSDVQDFTGYSKGFKQNSILGGVFEGAGQALDYAVKATDQYYKGTIKEQARDQTEKLLGDYGNDAAVATNAGLDSNVSPKEIQEGVNRLQLLKQATANGTLKESSFWAQAELISRQLKMRYPGYWEDVDKSVSQMLGRKPAQALHAELLSEAKASATKSDIERRQALAAARSAGLTEPFVREQNGKPMGTEEINLAVANRNNIKWQQETASRTYSLKKSRNESTEADAKVALRTEANTDLAVAFSDTSSALFSDRKSYEVYAKAVQDRVKSGQSIDPQLQSQITAAKSQLNSTVNSFKEKYRLKYGTDLSPETIEKEIEPLTKWFEEFTFQVEKGDLTVGKRNAAILSSTKDYDTFNFMMANEVFRKDGALKNFYGPEAYLTWESRHQGTKVIIDKDLAIEKFMTDDLQLGTKSITETINTMLKQGVQDPEAYKLHLTKTTDALTAKEVPSAVKENIFEKVFNDSEFMTKAVKEGERHQMFLNFTMPSKIRAISEQYKEGNISSKAFQSYSNWVRDNAVQLIHDFSPEVNSVAQYRKTKKVQYNPKTHQLTTTDVPYTPREDAGSFGAGVDAAYDRFRAGQSQGALDRVNEVLRNTKELIKVVGQDPDEEIPNLLQRSGVVLDVPEEKGPTGSEPITRGVGKGADLTVETLIKTMSVENLQKVLEKALEIIIEKNPKVPGIDPESP